MKSNFSRREQYNFNGLSECFDKAYKICIDPILPSEKIKMCFNVGKTGVHIIDNCTISKSDNNIFFHPANEEFCYVKDGFSLHKNSIFSLTFLKKKYGIVDMLNPGCYYHWVTNDFPRILLCYQAGFKDVIILDQGKIDIDNLKKFQKEFLDLLPDLKLFSLDNPIKTQSVCIPILPDEYGGEDKYMDGVHIYDYYTHRITRYASREIPKLFNLINQNKKRRLKIQRRGEKCRDPKNIDDFNNFLKEEWDFEVVYLEDFSVKEQMQMMRDSEIVIGAHGSGLVNFISANEESILIEYGDKLYYKISSTYEGKRARAKVKNFFHFLCEINEKKYQFVSIEDDVIDLNYMENILRKLLCVK